MKLTPKQKSLIAQYLQECISEFDEKNQIGNWHLRNLELRPTILNLLRSIQHRPYNNTL